MENVYYFRNKDGKKHHIIVILINDDVNDPYDIYIKVDVKQNIFMCIISQILK